MKYINIKSIVFISFISLFMLTSCSDSNDSISEKKSFTIINSVSETGTFSDITDINSVSDTESSTEVTNEENEYFDQEEDIPSLEDITSKANKNAMLAYTSAATYSTECEIYGTPLHGGWYVADLTNTVSDYKPDGNDFENAMRILMGSEVGGYCAVLISDSSAPERAYWSSNNAFDNIVLDSIPEKITIISDNDVIGGYPYDSELAFPAYYEGNIQDEMIVTSNANAKRIFTNASTKCVELEVSGKPLESGWYIYGSDKNDGYNDYCALYICDHYPTKALWCRSKVNIFKHIYLDELPDQLMTSNVNYIIGSYPTESKIGQDNFTVYNIEINKIEEKNGRVIED